MAQGLIGLCMNIALTTESVRLQQMVCKYVIIIVIVIVFLMFELVFFLNLNGKIRLHNIYQDIDR